MEESAEVDVRRYLRLVYKKRVLFALIASVVTTAIIVGGYMMPKIYEAKSIIYIERSFLEDLIKNVTMAPAFDEKIRALSVIMKSRSLLARVLQDIGIDVSRMSPEQAEAMITRYQNKTDIKVDLNRAPDLFIVSFSGSDPNLASNYVNALVHRYIQENLTLKREETAGANRFLTEQLTFNKEKLDRLDAQISHARRSRRIALPPDEQLLQMQKRLDALLSQYTENHPDVIKLKAEIERLENEMPARKKNPTTAQNTVSAITDGSRTPDGDAMSKGNLADLERERETTRKIYEDLLATRGKSEVSTQAEARSKAGVFRVIDPAVVPTKPVSPRTGLVVLLGILGGVAAGITVIMSLDMMDSSVRSVETAKKLGVPILAVIPTIQTQAETARVRKKDRLLYGAIGVYLTMVLSVAAMEALNLPYVDNMFKATKSQLKHVVKKISPRF